MKNLILAFLFLSISTSLFSKEGMWIPIFLQDVIMDDMKLNGYQLSAEDIYSINNSSMKDAVVRFGGGCTGEIISQHGLLLTNHHCGYGRIQAHSSVENDYLTNGYWASTLEHELPNPGLTATFIHRIVDVTDLYLTGIDEGMDQKTKDSIVEVNIASMIHGFTSGTHYEAFVKSFYNGNQFILFITETFKDVRLVGAPPSSIGKYGFDTDNWVWPRHTGDFSVFRIYANKDNLPAEYSKENLPLQAKYHFPISTKGYAEGDFTMVYGFPYKTEEYLTSDAVNFIVNVSNPKKIEVRTKKLEALNEHMKKSDEVRIKYAAKQSSTSNAWKKWQGQNKGLKKSKAIEQKLEFENRLAQKVKLYPDSFIQFEGLIERLNENYKLINEVALARDYYIEIGYYGTDAMQLAYKLMGFVSKMQSGRFTDQDEEKLNELLKSHFKDYDHATDKAVFNAIIPLYFEVEDNFYKPRIIKSIEAKKGNEISKWSNEVYENSILSNEEEMNSLLAKGSEKFLKVLQKDDLFDFASELNNFYKTEISPAYNAISKEIEPLNKDYFLLIKMAFPDQRYYADANGTLRLAYGKIEGMKPNDAVEYSFYTTFKGVIEKYDPTSDEYNLPEKLIELYESKDYGVYGENGELKVCFIASNHTSGGNSGSPVINAQGQLIGLNFDRNWEGTMSDINYDINQCRNISVDIRYVLFIIDKFAGAANIIGELTLIHD